MGPGGLLDAGDDLGLAVGDGPTRQDADATIDVAPCGNARSPVAALDDTRVEIERMVELAEMAMGFGALVPFGLQPFEGLDQMKGGLDRIRSGAGARDVDRQA